MLHPEQVDHINIVNWFNFTYPQYKEDLHHFANERRCSIQQGRLLKKMGVKKGVSDFFLAVPRDGKGGLWIELKVGTNKPTPEQKEFIERKINMGYTATCAWGAEAAKKVIKTYLR